MPRCGGPIEPRLLCASPSPLTFIPDGLPSLLFAAAALDAEMSDGKSEPEEPTADAIDDDEAAEILEAMLGLAPAAVQPAQPPKKKRRNPPKVSNYPLCYF